MFEEITTIETFNFIPSTFSIEVLMVERVLKNKKVIAETNNRKIITPDEDYSYLPQQFIDIVNFIFTEQFKQNYKIHKANIQAWYEQQSVEA